MTKVKPLTYQDQYSYYIALCQVASATSIDWSDYRNQITLIRTELKADPDYELLADKKFEAPPSEFGTTRGKKALEAMVETHGR
jgi:hypothetical protein